MESLIPIISKLQDVFTAIGSRASELELPQIVVSAGKSSVLEGIVGRFFLPRGSGIVTRRPLILHLVHTAQDDPIRKREEMVLQDDWAVLSTNLLNSLKTSTTFVWRLRQKQTGVVNLSVVDLPGITKNPIGDQPRDIEKQIRNMILNYITNANSLILAVTPANQDFANSEALQVAKEVDPEGDRTLLF
uniref:Dynamin-type G domain-containing protein n=1 Tax=Ditylenchus dipsaci TaxID=166011 RepID=A0A915CP35_9BILA